MTMSSSAASAQNLATTPPTPRRSKSSLATGTSSSTDRSSPTKPMPSWPPSSRCTESMKLPINSNGTIRPKTSRLSKGECLAAANRPNGCNRIGRRPRGWPPSRAGGLLMLRCLTGRSAFSPILGTAGFALAARGLTNLDASRLLGISGRRGIDVQKSIIIDQPVDDVYAFLSDPENYPRITDRITAMQNLGDGRYQQTIAGPAGMEITVEEKMLCDEEDGFVACRSEPSSPVQYAARAWFTPVGEGRTRVQIQATCNPPGGALTHSAARLAGLDLESQLSDVLMRAKTYLETGRAPHDAAKSKTRQKT